MNPNRGGSCIDSVDWIKTKKETKNPIHENENKCFQFTVTVALNHDKTRKNSQRIPKIKTFIDTCNWEKINYPSQNDDLKKIEKNNLTIALNALYAKKEKIYIYPAYVSKHNSNGERQIIFYIKCETYTIKNKGFDCFLEYTNSKEELIEYKCLCCNKNYQKKFDNLKKCFFNTNKFPNYDVNKFILLLRKGVYPYQNINYQDKLNKI